MVHRGAQACGQYRTGAHLPAATDLLPVGVEPARAAAWLVEVAADQARGLLQASLWFRPHPLLMVMPTLMVVPVVPVVLVLVPLWVLAYQHQHQH